MAKSKKKKAQKAQNVQNNEVLTNDLADDAQAEEVVEKAEVEKSAKLAKEEPKAKKDKKEQKAKKQKKAKEPKQNKVKETVAELKKVTWPTFGSVVKKTGIVLAVVVIFAVVLFGIDRLLAWLFDLLTNQVV